MQDLHGAGRERFALVDNLQEVEHHSDRHDHRDETDQRGDAEYLCNPSAEEPISGGRRNVRFCDRFGDPERFRSRCGKRQRPIDCGSSGWQAGNQENKSHPPRIASNRRMHNPPMFHTALESGFRMVSPFPKP